MADAESWSLYASPRNAVRRHLISCHGAGEQSGLVPPFARRTLPTRGLVYVSAGAGQYEEFSPRPRKVEVHAPAVIWLTPGVEHGYGPDPMGWAEHWVLFTGESFEAFEDLGLGNRHRPITALERPVDDAAAIFGELRRMLAAAGARSELAASIATQSLLLAILDATGSADDADEASSVIDKLTRDATLSIPVAVRARRVGVSVDDLRSIVRSATGYTLNEFVIDTRISRAQAFLAETDLPVRVVAERVGYDDQAYFSRIFSRRVGVSPIRFRQQQSRLGHSH